MLEIKNLYKKYSNSEHYALKNINLELKPGEIFGFLGPNGAGKSTTIKCIVGILPFDKGTISIDRINIKTNPQKSKVNFAYVSDNHAVFERLTGREYVNHIANLYHVTLDDREKRTDRFVKMFKLEKAYDSQIKSYSHGMKQKINVIAALVHNPKLWILDEPLLGLDPQSAFELKKVMREHADDGNTVFFSSHILEVVESLCERVGVVENGELKGVFKLSDLREKNVKLETVFMSLVGEEIEPVNVSKLYDKSWLKYVKEVEGENENERSSIEQAAEQIETIKTKKLKHLTEKTKTTKIKDISDKAEKTKTSKVKTEKIKKLKEKIKS